MFPSTVSDLTWHESENTQAFHRGDCASTDGVSIAPLIKGTGGLARKAIYWHFPHYSNHGMQSPGGAVRSGDYKLLDYFENNTVQLFNLRDDISEQNDLSRAEPERVAQLLAMLHAWRERVSARMMQLNLAYDPAKEQS